MVLLGVLFTIFLVESLSQNISLHIHEVDDGFVIKKSFVLVDGQDTRDAQSEYCAALEYISAVECDRFGAALAKVRLDAHIDDSLNIMNGDPTERKVVRLIRHIKHAMVEARAGFSTLTPEILGISGKYDYTQA